MKKLSIYYFGNSFIFITDFKNVLELRVNGLITLILDFSNLNWHQFCGKAI